MFTLIINPVSGGGRSLIILSEIRTILSSRNIEYREVYTGFPVNASQFSDICCGKDDIVAVMGGDGTMFDVLNNLPSLDMTLMYIPCGTGNDFVKCLMLPKDPVSAFLKQLDGTPRKVDLCSANQYRFINICGVGFDVNVLRKVSLYRNKYKGILAYLWAVASAVKEYEPITCRVAYDSGEAKTSAFTLISIGNGQYFGGGMKAVPSGDPCDGMLDIVEVDAIRKWQIWILLPLFVFGKHVNLKFARTRRCKRVEIQAEDMSIQMDGEVVDVPSLKACVVSGVINMRL